MKRFLKNLLWLPALIACALPQMPTAVAHLRLARPAPQVASCNPNLQIESVTYLGRNNGKDSVQVVFDGQAPASSNFNNPNTGFNNIGAATCARYGVPPLAQSGIQNSFSGNQGLQQGIGGGIGASQAFGYEVTVTIRRRLGNQDTATVKSNNIFSGRITTVVKIPRANLETDPVAYDVTVKSTFGGQLRRIFTAQGNGAPALAAATQAFANSSLVPLADNCFPSVSITGLIFTPGTGATPDAVTIDWTANRSPSDCFVGPRVFISVDVKHPDNSIGRGTARPNANTTTLNLSGAPAAAVSFIVRVTAETSLGMQFQVNKKGDF